MKKDSKTKHFPVNEEDFLSVVNEPAPDLQYTGPNLRIILGGNKAVNQPLSGDLDLIALTRTGIKKATLKSLAMYMGISMEQLSSLLHSSHRNIQRKQDNELLDTLKTEKVLELAAFVQRGIEVIGTAAYFAEWLQSPLPALDNKKPIDFLDTTFGIQILYKILGRLEYGVYS
ncbi:type II RES/Xre toxin-antitoxin system antitoxin [Niabella hirudinis]|uniref:type II RES/Xre toxin-antitoxin system antitoxin n=1 Tax=Niabella hirudinis TaxID=1285929 RepID=UPI003EBE941A